MGHILHPYIRKGLELSLGHFRLPLVSIKVRILVASNQNIFIVIYQPTRINQVGLLNGSKKCLIATRPLVLIGDQHQLKQI